MKKPNTNIAPSKQPIYKKIGRNFREYVPPLVNLNNYREPSAVKLPDTFAREYSPLFQPNEVFPEWPGDDVAKNFDFETTTTEHFTDSFHDLIMLPYSMRVESIGDVKWMRPDGYVREYLLEQEFKQKYPKRNATELRLQLKENYMKMLREKEIAKEFTPDLKRLSSVNLLAETAETVLDDLYIKKEYFTFYTKPLDLHVVNMFEREETKEEFKKRVEECEAQFVLKAKDLKDKKNPMTKVETQVMPTLTPIKKQDYIPSNISMKDGYCRYSKWLASVFQAIKDLKIPDVNSDSFFIQKIFPQRENIPIYNPKGKYWVKLIHMGRYRKIEIDDQMPCGKLHNILLPHCENIEELWPTLMAKALLKLYSYKYRNNNYDYEETGDSSIIYSLTGYVGEKIVPSLTMNWRPDLNAKEDKPCVLEKILSDQLYTSKMKFILGYFQTEDEVHLTTNELKLFSDFERRGPDRKLSCNIINHFHLIVKVPRMTSIQKSLLAQAFASNSKYKTELNTNNPEENGKNVNKIEDASLRFFNNISISEQKTRNNLIFPPGEVSSFHPTYEKSPSNILKKILQYKDKPHDNKKVNEKIFTDTAYAIVELFSSKDFNMKRLRPIDFSDLRINSNVKYKQMPPAEKKIYIQKFRQLKKIQKEEKQKRLCELEKPGMKHYLVKIVNNSQDTGNPELDFGIEFEKEEIEMAKICLENNWKYPPLDYFEFTFPPSVSSNTVTISNQTSCETLRYPIKRNKERNDRIKIEESQEPLPQMWTKELYTQIIKGEEDKYLTAKHPLKREEGAWMDLNALSAYFNLFLILHSPRYYYSTIACDNIWYNSDKDIYQPQEDMMVFHFIPKCNLLGKSSLLILFEANTQKSIPSKVAGFALKKAEPLEQFDEISYTIYLELEEMSQKKDRQKIILKNFFSTVQLEIDNASEYFLICKGGVYPFGYYMQLYSDHVIESMSNILYLKQHESFHYEKFSVVHPSMEQGRLYILSRFKSITLSEENDSNEIKSKRYNLLLSVGKYNDNYVKKYFEVYIIQNQTCEMKRIFLNQMTCISEEYFSSYFVISLVPPFNVQEKSFELEILWDKSNLRFELIDCIEPFTIKDMYKPNKNGYVFKELIYVPEISLVSMEISLKSQEFTDHLCEDPSIRMKIVLTHDDDLLLSSDFFNKTYIHNLVLKGKVFSILGKQTCKDKKNEKEKEKELLDNPQFKNIPYCLICYLDQSETPRELMNINQYQSNFFWEIRVFASESISFVKNTMKEDKEKAIIQSWEEEQPGRSERARNARLHFITKSKEKGLNNIAGDESNIVEMHNRTEVNKNPTIITLSKDLGKSNRVLVQKTGKLNTEPAFETFPLIGGFQINFAKILPNATLYKSMSLKNFIKYTNSERTIIKSTRDASVKLPTIGRNVEDQFCKTIKSREKEKEELNLKCDEYYTTKTADDFRTSELHKTMVGERNKFHEKLAVKRKKKRTQEEKLREKREEIKEQNQLRLDNKKKLENILIMSKSEQFDYNASLGLFHEVLESKGDIDNVLLSKAKDILSNKKEEIIKADLKKITHKDKALVHKHLDEISTNKFLIDEEILKKLKEFQ